VAKEFKEFRSSGVQEFRSSGVQVGIDLGIARKCASCLEIGDGSKPPIPGSLNSCNSLNFLNSFSE
jgi:hypothetical protein